MTDMVEENTNKKTKSTDLKNIEKGLYVVENCILKIVEDFGFAYDDKTKKYYNKNKSLCVDEETRLIYSIKETYDLSVVISMYKLNILDIKELK